MGKVSSLLIGSIAGAAAALVADYLFRPAPGTDFDQTYRSRLDAALDEGKIAAERERQQLLEEFKQAKQLASSQ